MTPARWLLPVIVLTTSACGSDPTPDVVHQYAVDLDQNYKDVIVGLQGLKSAVDAFVAAPTADGLTAAQTAYLAVRPIYGECEYSRFYGGPIDQAQGGMNEWPIDESFIDYTVDNPTGGIINDPVHYPQINAQVLATADEKGGIENLSTGFHAIEFLLWGERPSQTDGPGQRPYTDYLDGGTASNQDRRREYLTTATDLLLSDMIGLEAEWNLDDKSSYGAQFVAAAPAASLANLVRGFTNMLVSELFYERLDDPFLAQDQKDEESCFSESTYIDLNANALGCEDAYLGHYQALSGPSVSSLVAAKSPDLDAQLKQQISDVRAAIAAIPPPFDHAVIAPSDSPENMAVQAAVASFAPLQASLEQMAQLLGVTINL